MRLTRALIPFFVALAIPATSFAGSLLSYGFSKSVAHETVEGKHFTLYVHPKDKTILVQPKLVENLHDVPSQWPLVVWRQAAEAFVSPIGCGISDVKVLTRMGASWEATYICPDGVDLRSVAEAQRADLKRGTPLHLEAGVALDTAALVAKEPIASEAVENADPAAGR